jgi:hypothetical protein
VLRLLRGQRHLSRAPSPERTRRTRGLAKSAPIAAERLAGVESGGQARGWAALYEARRRSVVTCV